MHYGYSVKLARMNAKADASLIGVRLGQACINNDIPVATVAKRLRVSRQTVYGWFFGAVQPRAASVKAIETFIASLD